MFGKNLIKRAVAALTVGAAAYETSSCSGTCCPPPTCAANCADDSCGTTMRFAKNDDQEVQRDLKAEWMGKDVSTNASDSLDDLDNDVVDGHCDDTCCHNGKCSPADEMYDEAGYPMTPLDHVEFNEGMSYEGKCDHGCCGGHHHHEHDSMDDMDFEDNFDPNSISDEMLNDLFSEMSPEQYEMLQKEFEDNKDCGMFCQLQDRFNKTAQAFGFGGDNSCSDMCSSGTCSAPKMEEF